MEETNTSNPTPEQPVELDLLICTPGTGVTKGYLNSLLPLIAYLTDKKIRWAYSMQSSSHVADARELTLAGGFDSNFKNSKPFGGNVIYKKILWIDSDIIFTVEDFEKLWESDKDIVAGMYLLQNGNTAVHMNEVGRPLTFDEAKEKTEPFVAWGTGFGFVMVKQGVFESLRRPWFQSAPIKKTFDDGTVYEFNILGEDLSWSHRVKTECDYEIWIDPSVKVIHQKTMLLTWEGIRI
jgi:hypothetical protein